MGGLGKDGRGKVPYEGRLERGRDGLSQKILRLDVYSEGPNI